MLRRVLATSAACSLGGLWLAGGWASAAVPHTVLPGESLWSISAANGLSVDSLAAYNGLAGDAYLMAGATINVPAIGGGGAAPSVTAAPPASAPGVSPIPSPDGD